MKTLLALTAAALALASVGCTDLKPLQAEVDQLKTQVADLSSKEDRMKVDIDNAAQTASAAKSAAEQAQNRADAAARTADATNEKLERMFNKSLQK